MEKRQPGADEDAGKEKKMDVARKLGAVSVTGQGIRSNSTLKGLCHELLASL